MPTARVVGKIAAAAVGGFVGCCFGSFLGTAAGAVLGGESGGPGPSEVGGTLGMIVGATGGACLGAFLVGRPAVAGWCLLSACGVGIAAFLAGFIGPILTAPDSPQGPLLGIFFTGPLGFLIGAIVGLGVGLAKEREKKG
jgi:hypothetical protein